MQSLPALALIWAITLLVSLDFQVLTLGVRMNTTRVSIDLATQQLGINPIWLTWERSSLVLILIFLSRIGGDGRMFSKYREQMAAAYTASRIKITS